MWTVVVRTQHKGDKVLVEDDRRTAHWLSHSDYVEVEAVVGDCGEREAVERSMRVHPSNWGLDGV